MGATGPCRGAAIRQPARFIGGSRDDVVLDFFPMGTGNSGLNIDSQGNVWVTNRFGKRLFEIFFKIFFFL